LRICKKCIQPDTRPDIFFDEHGICGACIWNEEKSKIDWSKREQELQEISDWAKKTSKSNYDCVVGISGGKDSTLQAITARDKLGLRCLLVNSEPEGITEIGKYNIENLKNLGFDVISLRPNPKLMKKLIKRDFYKYLNPQKVTEFSLYSSGYIIADEFNIPLIIQGENAALTLGVSNTGMGKGYDALEITESNTLSTGWQDYLDVDDVEEKDLYMFHFNKKRIQEKGIKAIWLQYFLKDWSNHNNAKFAEKHGFKTRPSNFNPSTIGTYVSYSQLDSDLIQVNQLLKCVKFGFGQCLDHTCYDLRDGRITRKEALDLVKKYDGKCSPKYVKKFCNYVGINLDEFYQNVEKFRGTMWKKIDGSWKNMFLEDLENIYR
jgi:N-acetyl sugar amidotransferase